MEYFRKQGNRLFGSRLWCMRFPLLWCFYAGSLLSPDLFLSSLLGGACYFNSFLSLFYDNLFTPICTGCRGKGNLIFYLLFVLGHRQILTTLKVYTHICNPCLQYGL